MNNKYVLLRGLVRGNGHWGHFLEILAEHDPKAEIEVYEIPGNGTRYQEITPTTAEEVIADFRKRSEFVKNKTPFILCGISLGGMLALKWLELFPDDINKTFVVNSSLKALSPFYHRLSVKNYLKILKIVFSTSAESKELNVLKLTSNRKDLDPRVVAQLVAFSKNHPVETTNFIRQLILANSIKISKELRKPINIVQSAKDRLVDPRCSNKIAEYLEAPLITHPTAGHDIPLDDPEWLLKILMTN